MAQDTLKVDIMKSLDFKQWLNLRDTLKKYFPHYAYYVSSFKKNAFSYLFYKVHIKKINYWSELILY